MSSVSIAEGHVFHSRTGRIANAFRYPIFYVSFDCANETELKNQLRSRFFGALSFKAKDYLDGSEAPLFDSVRNFIQSRCAYDPQQVTLQTLPRVFGYAFNPINFWFCRRNGKLDAVLCEVHNTFNEKHYYWLRPDNGIFQDTWLTAKKIFHVSPFFSRSGLVLFQVFRK